MPNLWEFPGGKIEKDETSKQTVAREIKEEMQCKLEVQDKVEHTVYEYDFGIVHLTTYFCELLKGEPVLVEHEAIKWLTPQELPGLEWAEKALPILREVHSFLCEGCERVADAKGLMDGWVYLFKTLIKMIHLAILYMKVYYYPFRFGSNQFRSFH